MISPEATPLDNTGRPFAPTENKWEYPPWQPQGLQQKQTENDGGWGDAASPDYEGVTQKFQTNRPKMDTILICLTRKTYSTSSF